MPDVDGFAPGTPSWVDLASPDLDASTAFYGALFGWRAHEAGEGDEAGGYRMFTLRDRAVAGLGPLQNGQSPVWMTYVTVDDADATSEKVEAAGGMAFTEPFDVLDAGRMAVFADSTGAAFAIWQPRAHIGSEIVNEPGALTWNELATRDTETAKAFYGEVFGWEAETREMGGTEYTTFKLPGAENSIAGMLSMGDTFPADVPPHWMAYVQVEDCAEATAHAKELGASVFVDCREIEIGRWSAIADPQGAVVSLWEPKAA